MACRCASPSATPAVRRDLGTCHGTSSRAAAMKAMFAARRSSGRFYAHVGRASGGKTTEADWRQRQGSAVILTRHRPPRTDPAATAPRCGSVLARALIICQRRITVLGPGVTSETLGAQVVQHRLTEHGVGRALGRAAVFYAVTIASTAAASGSTGSGASSSR